MNGLAVLRHLPKPIAKTAGKLAFKLNKNKPQIMVIGGAVVAVTGFVWAIVSATKIRDTMTINETKLDDIQQRKTEAETIVDEEEKTKALALCDKDIRKAKVGAAWDLTKLMGFPCLLFLGGISLCIGGHMILVRRFGQLSTAFATLQQTFERYRQMNIAEHGVECDQRYRYGITGYEKIDDTVVDEDGKEHKRHHKLPIIDPNDAASMYTFCFSEDFSWRCPKDPVSMLSFLAAQQKYWNEWMSSSGMPVTLYMVLNDLGIHLDPDDPRNDYILLAGWRPNGDGDNCIDFGVKRAINKPAMDLLENVCYLNFNCDGNIFHSTRYTKDGRKVS